MEAVKVPLTEASSNPRGIPTAQFIENVAEFVQKYSAQATITQMNELYNKYKFMETQLQRSKASMKLKIPDIKKTLEMVKFLQDKNETESPEIVTNFLLADNIWARARIPNNKKAVCLWLGAQVMVEYSFEEAINLLEKNLANAHKNQESTEQDISYIKDQITTTEVNMARIYNEDVTQKQLKGAQQQVEKQ